jgi:hypothetical protein
VFKSAFKERVMGNYEGKGYSYGSSDATVSEDYRIIKSKTVTMLF